MNIDPGQIPDLLKGLGNVRETGELLDSFGTMRVTDLEVQCPDGLQV